MKAKPIIDTGWMVLEQAELQEQRNWWQRKGTDIHLLCRPTCKKVFGVPDWAKRFRLKGFARNAEGRRVVRLRGQACRKCKLAYYSLSASVQHPRGLLIDGLHHLLFRNKTFGWALKRGKLVTLYVEAEWKQ